MVGRGAFMDRLALNIARITAGYTQQRMKIIKMLEVLLNKNMGSCFLMSLANEIMTSAEVAILLRVSRWSVYEMVKMRQIPYFKIGRSVRFRHSELIEWTKKSPN